MRWRARANGTPAWKRRWHRLAAKPVPSRPTPRLYLATPVVDDPTALAAGLPGLLAEADIAAALLLDGHVDLVARSGADGAHLTGIRVFEEALPTLKPDRIAGVSGLATRHDSMTAGELGADYVLFGEPDAKGLRPSMEAIAERLQWWEELFEPPCVGFAASIQEAAEFAAAGADFVLVGDFVWAEPRGAKAALTDTGQAIAQAHEAA